MRFVPNPFIGELLKRSPLVKSALENRAEEAVEQVKAIAPVDTGAFRDSIHTTTENGDVQLVADVPHAVYVEFGTSDTPIFAPLRRGAEATFGTNSLKGG